MDGEGDTAMVPLVLWGAYMCYQVLERRPRKQIGRIYQILPPTTGAGLGWSVESEGY